MPAKPTFDGALEEALGVLLLSSMLRQPESAMHGTESALAGTVRCSREAEERPPASASANARQRAWSSASEQSSTRVDCSGSSVCARTARR
jgi:hypothetical protein